MHIVYIDNVSEGQNHLKSNPWVLYRQCLTDNFFGLIYFLNFEKTTLVQTMFRKKSPIPLAVISAECCIQNLQPAPDNTTHP